MPDSAFDSTLLHEISSLTRVAGQIALESRANMTRELKPDGSIVTSADREVEAFLRKELPKIVPQTTVWGEEFGFEAEGPAGLWLVDPIDGTSNYAYGGPLWGVSVALFKKGSIVLGCIALPDLDEDFASGTGLGATMNGHSLAPIPSGPVLAQELISFNDTVARQISSRPISGKRRDYGSFVVSGAFVATQRCRGLIGMREKLYDCAAAIVLCQELGADVRYLDGSPFVPSELVVDRVIDRPWAIYPSTSGLFDSGTDA